MSIFFIILTLIAWLASAMWSVIEMTNEKVSKRALLSFIALLTTSSILVIIIFTTTVVNR